MDGEGSNYWARPQARVTVPGPPAEPWIEGGRESKERSGQLVVLVLLVLFLIDTFLPWQRACLDVSGFGLRIAGCFSANAWTASGAHVGQAAGIFAIAAIVAVGLQLGDAGLGDGAKLAARLGVYGTVVAGSLKWLLVIGKLASFGAWIGLLVLLAIAIVESAGLLADR